MKIKRYAILIGSSEFPLEPGLEQLCSPSNDVKDLAEVLSDAKRGRFDEVHTLMNRPHYEVILSIQSTLKKLRSKDMILIYYSGHGRRNRTGKLYLTTSNTVNETLEATSVPVNLVKELIQDSSARKVILILDCCYSGAISDVATKGGVDDELIQMGAGTCILTATNSIQTALAYHKDQHSVFTKHLIAGIESGDADEDHDGIITVDELYSYVYQHVRNECNQEPTKFSNEVQGNLVIAYSGRAVLKDMRAFLLKKAQCNQVTDTILADAMQVLNRELEKDNKIQAKQRSLLHRYYEEKVDDRDFCSQWFALQAQLLVNNNQMDKDQNSSLLNEKHSKPDSTHNSSITAPKESDERQQNSNDDVVQRTDTISKPESHADTDSNKQSSSTDAARPESIRVEISKQINQFANSPSDQRPEVPKHSIRDKILTMFSFRKSILFGFMAVIATGVLIWFFSQSGLTNFSYEKRLVKQGKVEQAIASYSEKIQENPTNALAYHYRGRAYSAKKNYQLALRDYNKAIELNPEMLKKYKYDYALAYFNKGFSYEAEQRYARAISAYTQAIQIDPGLIKAYKHRAEAYIKQGNYESAVNDYKVIEKKEPDNAVDQLKTIASKLIERSRQSINSKKYAQAIMDYELAISLDSSYVNKYRNKFAIAYLRLGLQKEKANHNEQAIKDYTKSIELNPRNVVAYNNRGMTYSKVAKYDLAIRDFQKAISLNPKWAIVYNNRGDTYMLLKKYSYAIRDYSTAISIDPNDGLTYYFRAEAYRKQGSLMKALEDYNLAVKLNPKHVLSIHNRGVVYILMRHYDKAIADFRKTIELNPTLAAAYNNLGDIYVFQAKYDKAIQEYTKAIRLKPTDWVTYATRGGAYRKRRQFDHALIDYSEAIKLNPKYALAYHYRGYIHSVKGNYEDALYDFNQAIKLNPKYVMAYNNRGDLLSKQGQYNLAIKDYDISIRLNPKDALTYSARGEAYRKQNEFEKALVNYNQAIELKPDYSLAYHNRGFTYSQQGKYLLAIADYNKAIKLNSKFAVAYDNRGYAYYKLRMFDKAIADFKQARTLNPGFLKKYKSTYAAPYVSRGKQYWQASKKDKACQDWKNACEFGKCGLYYKNCDSDSL